MKRAILGMAATAVMAAAMAAQAGIPEAAHPDFALSQVALPAKYKTMGLEFLPDGRMALAAIDQVGGGEIPAPSANVKVLIVSGLAEGAPQVKEVANTWRQIAGLVVAEGRLYVSDRDGFYQILDLDNPSDLKANRKLIVKWPTGKWSHGEQWHQWVFTPMYRAGWFYAPYSGSIIPGGPSGTAPTSDYTGAFLKWNLDGVIEKFAGGLRSPNGANINAAGEMFVADNQGSWLPSSTFMHMKPGRFYGHSNTTQAKPDQKNWAETLPYERPTAWLDNGILRTSPSQPVHVPKGPYAGDWLLGDCYNPGLVRIALDDVQGTYNGSVFWFSKGTASSAINRMAWGPDGALYLGTILKIGNWPSGDLSPLYKLTPSATPSAFDMRVVRSFKGGVEITFTEALDKTTATTAAFQVKQWKYLRQEGYGQGKQPAQDRAVSAVEFSGDGKRAFLRIAGLLDDQVVYIKAGALKSASGKTLWNNEAWYTLNRQNEGEWAPNVGISRRAPSPLAGKVAARALSGALEVSVDEAGPHVVTLRTLDGALIAKAFGPGGNASGQGPARHLLPVGRAARLLVLEVRAAGTVESRVIPVSASR